MLRNRKKVQPAGPQPWAIRTPAELRDRNEWPILKGARVCARTHGHRWTGQVLDVYRDHKGREIVEVLVDTQTRSFRPEVCRVQQQSGSLHRRRRSA